MTSRAFVNLDFVSSNTRVSNWYTINGTHGCFVPGLSLSKAAALLSESMLVAALLFRQRGWMPGSMTSLGQLPGCNDLDVSVIELGRLFHGLLCYALISVWHGGTACFPTCCASGTNLD